MAMHGARDGRGTPQHTGKRQAKPDVRAVLGRRLAVFLVVVVAFCGGFLIRGNEDLMTSLGFSGSASEQNPGDTIVGSTYSSIAARVAEIEGILVNDSLDSFDLDSTTSSVIDAFAASTADPYLRYFDPARYSVYMSEVKTGSYDGIGVLFAEYNGQAYAVDVFDGSSAQAAGVQQGDFIVAIDGDSSQQWTATETINALKRDPGSTVVITWRRPESLEADGGETFNTTIAIGSYSEQNVTTELHGTVGYIKVSQITQNSASFVRTAIEELAGEGARSFVLDVRDCPGGYLTQAVDIASLFVKSGTIVQIQTRDATTTKTASGHTATESPLVVIVNGNTAAAAEVLAASLQDSDRAQLVGTTTMGKGSVQVVRELSFGGALRYTAAHYLTPQGRDFNGMGISPDFTVEAAEGSDNQKTIALDTAESLVQG